MADFNPSEHPRDRLGRFRDLTGPQVKGLHTIGAGGGVVQKGAPHNNVSRKLHDKGLISGKGWPADPYVLTHEGHEALKAHRQRDENVPRFEPIRAMNRNRVATGGHMSGADARAEQAVVRRLREEHDGLLRQGRTAEAANVQAAIDRALARLERSRADDERVGGRRNALSVDTDMFRNMAPGETRTVNGHTVVRKGEQGRGKFGTGEPNYAWTVDGLLANDPFTLKLLLREAPYTERLHPRDRRGHWRSAGSQALKAYVGAPVLPDVRHESAPTSEAEPGQVDEMVGSMVDGLAEELGFLGEKDLRAASDATIRRLQLVEKALGSKPHPALAAECRRRNIKEADMSNPFLRGLVERDLQEWASHWEERMHPRGRGGKFVRKGLAEPKPRGGGFKFGQIPSSLETHDMDTLLSDVTVTQRRPTDNPELWAHPSWPARARFRDRQNRSGLFDPKGMETQRARDRASDPAVIATRGRKGGWNLTPQGRKDIASRRDAVRTGPTDKQVTDALVVDSDAVDATVSGPALFKDGKLTAAGHAQVDEDAARRRQAHGWKAADRRNKIDTGRYPGGERYLEALDRQWRTKGVTNAVTQNKIAMARAQFEDIADYVQATPKGEREKLATAFADRFQGTNPLFDRVRFIKAATGEAPQRRRSRGPSNMTHGHYQLIAGVLRDSNVTSGTLKSFADALEGSNAHFKRDRFMRAAEPVSARQNKLAQDGRSPSKTWKALERLTGTLEGMAAIPKTPPGGRRGRLYY